MNMDMIFELICCFMERIIIKMLYVNYQKKKYIKYWKVINFFLFLSKGRERKKNEVKLVINKS